MIRVAFSVFLFFLLLTEPLDAQSPKIFLKTFPAIEQARPVSEPVKLVLEVKETEAESLNIQLHAPPPGWIFSTDYPFVEGSLLLDMKLPVREGRVEWEYVFPIRGVYRLEVSVVNGKGGEVKEDFEFRIKESSFKLVYLAISLAFLFLFGWIAGRLFTAGGQAQKIVSIQLIVASLLMGLPSELFAMLDVGPAIVGKPTRIVWRDSRNGATQPPASIVTLSIVREEEGKRIFHLEKVSTGGSLSVDFQFFDGSEHKVRALAEREGGGFIEEEKIVTVTAMEPPREAIFPAFFLFLIVLALGLISGSLSRLVKRGF